MHGVLDVTQCDSVPCGMTCVCGNATDDVPVLEAIISSAAADDLDAPFSSALHV